MNLEIKDLIKEAKTSVREKFLKEYENPEEVDSALLKIREVLSIIKESEHDFESCFSEFVKKIDMKEDLVKKFLSNF